jgi:hypothetical protein
MIVDPYPSSAAELVAQIALRRSLAFFVAVHASRHRNLLLAPKRLTSLHLAVTGRAIGFGLQMSLMAEEDKAGQFVDAHPGDFLLGLFIGLECLQRGACGLEFAMTG